MWIVLAAVAIAAAIGGHAMLSRVAGLALNMVTRFVVAGVPIGIALMLGLVWRGNSGLQVLAGLLFYALACEIYIFVFTMISSSVSVSLLLRLRGGPANWAQLDSAYNDAAMVDGRMAKLVANDLVTSTQSGYVVTSRGEALVTNFVRLRRFFRHPGSDVERGTQRLSRVEARRSAGHDVG